jgi:predicted transcriptional regulator of viral defense system
MESFNKTIRVGAWVEKLLSFGKNSFSIEEAESALPDLSKIALRSALGRLSKKGKILSIFRGFYIIIPPQYALRGILPPALFIDALMKHLGKQYYLGLLTAAALHGAAHQQPQEFFVFTTFPTMRATKRNELKINYISRREIPEALLQDRKTESGYIKISSPVLTAIDLLQYQHRIGGLNRAATVISELAESIKPEDFSDTLFYVAPVASVQRLGYLLDRVLGSAVLADYLFDSAKQAGVKFQRIPLSMKNVRGLFAIDKKWDILINVTIDTEI